MLDTVRPEAYDSGWVTYSYTTLHISFHLWIFINVDTQAPKETKLSSQKIW